MGQIEQRPMIVVDGSAGRRAVILNYGIAHPVDASTLTGTHEVLRTPACMAPEQARGETALRSAGARPTAAQARARGAAG